MRIGLIDADGHNFPNLALMKLSAWHRIRGDTVEFVNHFFHYDKVYKSKIFTFSRDDPTSILTDELITGGTGYKNYNCLNDDIEHICPDYTLYPNYSHIALGFLTRGCPNKCPWCIVPLKEGVLKPHADISEFLDSRKDAILLDNNVLASNFGLSQIEKIIDLKIRVDFNQGLEARQIANNQDIAKLLCCVKWRRFLRIACDTSLMLPIIEKTVDHLNKFGIKSYRIFCYALITDDINESFARIMRLKQIGVIPFAQPYRDYNQLSEPTLEQKQLARWVNHKAIFNSTTFQNYKS